MRYYMSTVCNRSEKYETLMFKAKQLLALIPCFITIIKSTVSFCHEWKHC